MLSISITTLILVVLAVFYWSYVICFTDGPFGTFSWLRGHVSLGGLTGCPYCLAPWIAALFLALSVLGGVVGDIIIAIFGIAGMAMLLYRYTGGSHL